MSSDDGATLVSLWLLDGNAAAEPLYRRAGYLRSGVRTPMPRDRSLTEERWTKSLAGDGSAAPSPGSPSPG